MTYIWSIFRVFIQGILPVLIGLVLGNVFSPEHYGYFVSYLLFFTTIGFFFSLPAAVAAIHYILKAKSENEKDHYFSLSVFINFFNSLIVCIVMLIFKEELITFFQIPATTNYALLLVLSILSVNYTFFSKMMTVHLLIKEQFIVLLFSAIAQVFLVAYCIYYSLGIDKVLYSYVLFYVICNIGYFHRLIKEFNLVFSNSPSKLYQLFKFGGISYLGVITGYLDEYLDLLSINYFLDKTQLAYYSYAITAGMLLYGFGLAISHVTYPKFCKLFAEDNRIARYQLYRQSVDYLFAFFILLGLIIVYFAEYIIPLILPEAYLAMIPALIIIVPGIVIFSAFSGVGTYLTSAGKPHFGLILVFITVLLNALLNFLLIPIYGIIGAAIATTASFILRVIIGFWLNEIAVGTGYRLRKLYITYLGFICLCIPYADISITIKSTICLLFLIALLFIYLNSDDRRFFMSYIKRLNIKFGK